MPALATLATKIDFGHGNHRAELPLLEPTLGPPMIDTRRSAQETGCWAYDPSFGETGACRSAITYVDGDNGVLLYRGYPIDELVESCGLPRSLLAAAQRRSAERRRSATIHRRHHPSHDAERAAARDLSRVPPRCHPMAVMCGVVGALAAFYHDGLDIFDPHHRMIASHRLIAKMPTIAAMAYKYSLGQPFIYPRNDLGYAENFLHMLFAVPCEAYRARPGGGAGARRAADHPGRSRAERLDLGDAARRLDPRQPLRRTAAAIAALWGPLHGGANEAVLQTLEEIGRVERIPRCCAAPRTRTTRSA